MILSVPAANRAEADVFVKRCGIKLSSAYRCFKHETAEDILDYKSLGPKNYALTLQDPKDTEKVTQAVKVRGFSLRSSYASKDLTGDLMRTYIDAMLKEEVKKQPVNQFRISIGKKTRKLYTNIFIKQYSNENTCKKRVVIRNTEIPVYQTFPYGAPPEMHARAIKEARKQFEKTSL